MRIPVPTRIAAYIVISCMLLGVSASLAETRAEARPIQKSETNVRDAAALAIDDGPYASYQNGKPGLNVSWVCKGKAIRKTVAKADGAVLNPECGFPIPINIRDESPAFPVTALFTAKKLVALSDIHGRFDTMVRLLRANAVIDREMKWAFGEGHVVVVGDMFDRGPNVTDVLWLLYQPMRPFAHRGGTQHNERCVLA